jgi:hypothetical protein
VAAAASEPVLVESELIVVAAPELADALAELLLSCVVAPLLLSCVVAPLPSPSMPRSPQAVAAIASHPAKTHGVAPMVPSTTSNRALQNGQHGSERST